MSPKPDGNRSGVNLPWRTTPKFSPLPTLGLVPARRAPFHDDRVTGRADPQDIAGERGEACSRGTRVVERGRAGARAARRHREGKEGRVRRAGERLAVRADQRWPVSQVAAGRLEGGAAPELHVPDDRAVRQQVTAGWPVDVQPAHGLLLRAERASDGGERERPVAVDPRQRGRHREAARRAGQRHGRGIRGPVVQQPAGGDREDLHAPSRCRSPRPRRVACPSWTGRLGRLRRPFPG